MKHNYINTLEINELLDLYEFEMAYLEGWLESKATPPDNLS